MMMTLYPLLAATSKSSGSYASYARLDCAMMMMMYLVAAWLIIAAASLSLWQNW